jgi:glyoxylase-like metal-dependent hydrolase (beta-lactamase superfamily II)
MVGSEPSVTVRGVSDPVVRRVSDHVWWYTPDERTDRPALALVAGSASSALLDVGASPAHTAGFLGAIAALDVPPLAWAVLTHWHWDHSFGGAALDVPIVGHAETRAALVHQASLDWSDEALDARVAAGTEIAFCRDMVRLELPDRSALEIVPPQLTFRDRIVLDLGGLTCDVRHVGGDHAADSCVVHVVEDRLLFLGDCLYQRMYAPVEHLTPARLRALVETIALLEADVAITGHGDEPLDRAGLGDQLDMLARAVAAAEELGPAALDRATGEEERETLQFLLAGIALA